MSGLGIAMSAILPAKLMMCGFVIFVSSRSVMRWESHIVSDKEVLLGKPVIKGTRISVELILELLEAGWSEQAILESYPTITQTHLQAVFAYLRACLQNELLFPLPKRA